MSIIRIVVFAFYAKNIIIKINEHYKNCGFCFLCKKYNNFRARFKQEFEDDEKEKLLNDKRDKINERTNNNQKDITIMHIMQVRIPLKKIDFYLHIYHIHYIVIISKIL